MVTIQCEWEQEKRIVYNAQFDIHHTIFRSINFLLIFDDSPFSLNAFCMQYELHRDVFLVDIHFMQCWFRLQLKNIEISQKKG